MSNYLAIAAVTSALKQIIAEEIQAIPDISASPEVRVGRPPTDAAFVGANVFMFRTAPNAFHRNDDLATRRADGVLTRTPVAAIDLEYLISFYGNEAELEPQRLMGATLAALHANPLLSPKRIRETIANAGPHHFLRAADIGRQDEAVRFTPVVLDIETLSKMWSVFGQAPYAPTVAYVASPILLELELLPQKALPVSNMGSGIRSSGPPVLSALRPSTLLPDAPRTIHVNAVNVDSDAEIIVSGEPAVAARSGNGADITIPGDVRSGPVLVLARVPAADGLPPIESNALTLAVVPSVAEGAHYESGTVTLCVSPDVPASAPVAIRLNPYASTGSGVYTSALLRQTIAPALAATLDSGVLSDELLRAFAQSDVPLPTAPHLQVQTRSARWIVRSTNDPSAPLILIRRDTNALAVYYGISAACAFGTIAFSVGALASGSYLVGVEVGGVPSAMLSGTRIAHLAGSAQEIDDKSVTAALRASGVKLTGTLQLARRDPSGAALFTQIGTTTRYWVRQEAGIWNIFVLDAPSSPYIGPLLVVR